MLKENEARLIVQGNTTNNVCLMKWNSNSIILWTIFLFSLNWNNDSVFSKENKIIKKDNKGEVEKMRTLILQPPAVGRGPQESQVSIYTDMICVFTGEVLGWGIRTRRGVVRLLLLTSPEMRETPGAQNGLELHFHVIRLCVTRVCKFLSS